MVKIRVDLGEFLSKSQVPRNRPRGCFLAENLENRVDFGILPFKWAKSVRICGNFCQNHKSREKTVLAAVSPPKTSKIALILAFCRLNGQNPCKFRGISAEITSPAKSSAWLFSRRNPQKSRRFVSFCRLNGQFPRGFGGISVKIAKPRENTVHTIFPA